MCLALAAVAGLLMAGSAVPASGATGGGAPPPLLVFDANPHARTYGHLFALDPRTGQRVRLTFGPTNEPRGLARWSPNGEKFLYMSESPTPGSFDLIVEDADGSNRRPLFTTNGSYIFGAAWSPDSSRIVLTVEPQGAEQESLLFLDTATGRQHTVELGMRERGATSVSWSKHDVIAFEAVATGTSSDSVGELYTVKPDGTDLHVLARPQYPEQGLAEPRWSPDGRHIVFTREQPLGNVEVVVVGPEGNLLRRVPTRPGARSVAWAPDGRHLIFIAGDDDLYTVALDGSGERLITRGVYEPDWRPGTRYQLPASGG